MGSQSALRYTLRRHGLTRELHGSRPSPSPCFCYHAEPYLFHTLPLSYLHTLNTLTTVPATICFLCRGLPNQATVLVSSRGGVGADIHRPIRTSVRILIWQDYKHGYTSACTARSYDLSHLGTRYPYAVSFATIRFRRHMRFPFHTSSYRNVPRQSSRYQTE